MNTNQTTSPAVGIDDIAFATGANRIDLAELAGRFGVEPAKYYVGLGQSEMSVPAADEDIVTMAAAAAAPIDRCTAPDERKEGQHPMLALRGVRGSER